MKKQTKIAVCAEANGSVDGHRAPQTPPVCFIRGRERKGLGKAFAALGGKSPGTRTPPRTILSLLQIKGCVVAGCGLVALGGTPKQELAQQMERIRQ